MDEFWRFSKLRKVNIWYIKENGVFRKVLVVWKKNLESFGLRLKIWLWKA